MRRVSTRRSGQRGNTILEAALMIAPFFLLLFGVADFSTVLFLKSTLQNSVNQAVKFAVTGETLPGMCHEDSIRKILQTNSLGLLSHDNEKLIAIRYYALSDLSQPVEGPHGTAPGNVVEVTVRDYTWNRNPARITVSAVDRMEGRARIVAQPCR